MAKPITYRLIARKSWPIILANAAVPLLGLTDTAVIGHFGRVADLGAIALGSILFSFVYWSFGFLRMSTSGFIAQAHGANDELEVRAIFARAALLALTIGFFLIGCQVGIETIAFKLFTASHGVEDIAKSYFTLRIFGAPATLFCFVVTGTLIALGDSRRLLIMQLFLNGSNIILDLILAGFLKLGAEGIALGTLIAEWLTAILGWYLVRRLFKARWDRKNSFWPWQLIKQGKKFVLTLKANVNILLRTLTIIFSFAFFTNQAALYSDEALAANHILLQFISFSAFFLDGYAFVTEALVGEAIGAGNSIKLRKAIVKSTNLAAVTACVLALSIFLLGPAITELLTNSQEVLRIASEFIPLAALYVLISFAAFQLDGIYIGAAYTRQMRDAAFIAVIIFLAAWWLLTPGFAMQGLWFAFILYVAARAISLLMLSSELRQQLKK